MNPYQLMANLLRRVRPHVVASSNCVWSSMDKWEIMELIDQSCRFEQADFKIDLPELIFLFAPTGPLQEMSIDNHWADEYSSLSSEFDKLVKKLRVDEEILDSETGQQIGDVQDRIELVQGDITDLIVDCVVTAANEFLCGGGGVDGAVHDSAGPELLETCRSLAPCPPGNAVVTDGFELKALKVIHAVGPIFHEIESDSVILENAYRNSLRLAKEYGVDSVAFPCISTGAYGFPMQPAAEIAFRTVVQFLRANALPRVVVFCCFDHDNFGLYAELIDRL